MRKFSGLCVVLLCAGFARSAAAATLAQFDHVAEITDISETKFAVRVKLTAPLLQATRQPWHDFRIFDEQGNEVPYFLYEATDATLRRNAFAFIIHDYREQGQTAQLILAVPEGVERWNELTLALDATDFRKSVEVFTSTSPSQNATWNSVATDIIYDFSSRVALRKTSIAIPAQTARYVKLVLRDLSAQQTQALLALKAEGIDVTMHAGATAAAPWHIDSVDGVSEDLSGTAPRLDELVVPAPAQSIEQGVSTLPLGRVQLPLCNIALHVQTPYFFRNVQLGTAARDDANAYVDTQLGAIYNLPELPSAVTALAITAPLEPFVRVRIHNGDSPPLAIDAVTLHWQRRELVFMPTAGHHYTIAVGNDSLPPPQYDLAQIITSDTAMRDYPTVTIGALTPNPKYRAPPPPPSANRGRTLLTSVIGVVVLILGFWSYRLLRNLPDASAKK